MDDCAYGGTRYPDAMVGPGGGAALGDCTWSAGTGVSDEARALLVAVRLEQS
jgi:hypothetical protein